MASTKIRTQSANPTAPGALWRRNSRRAFMAGAPSLQASLQTHPRIGERVNQVRQQIDEHVGNGDEQNAALEQRIVAGFDGLHGEASDARPGKNCFGDDGAGEQRPELQSENGENGNQRVAKSVAEEDGAFAEAFGARGADVVAGKLFEDGGAHHARENGGERGAKSNGGKDEMPEAAASADGKPA